MPIKTATIQEAQRNFSSILDMVDTGTEVLLTDGFQILAKLTPLTQVEKTVGSVLGNLEPLPEFFWCS